MPLAICNVCKIFVRNAGNDTRYWVNRYWITHKYNILQTICWSTHMGVILYSYTKYILHVNISTILLSSSSAIMRYANRCKTELDRLLDLSVPTGSTFTFLKGKWYLSSHRDNVNTGIAQYLCAFYKLQM